MSRQRPRPETDTPDLLAAALGDRLRVPLAVVLGSPRLAADIAGLLDERDITCFQLDLYQAERLQEQLAELGVDATVQTAPDLWDLTADFQTVIFPAQRGGERSLKLDMVEQAFHILQPGGTFAVVSDYPNDQFFAEQLRKVFGKIHVPEAGEGYVVWSPRRANRPRRRHEVTYQARIGAGPSLRFLSRPGVFSYGRFDDGARALLEVTEIRQGDRVLDAGCGCGTNGIVAGLRAGAESWITFVDSNVRAVALTEHNARSNGLTSFETLARADLADLPPKHFDLILANPPYYAQHTIAEKFIREARPLLRHGGRFYLVTKQPDTIGPMMATVFGPTEPVERRGYTVLCAGV
jgi:16S rRNA (guanine1207-N2)-methyltransferase